MSFGRMWPSILLAICRHKYYNVLWSNNNLEIRNHHKWIWWWLASYNIEYSISPNERNRINNCSVYNWRKRKKVFNAKNTARMCIFSFVSFTKHVSLKILSWKCINIWKLFSFSVIIYLPRLFFDRNVIYSLECKHWNIPNSFDSNRYCPCYINQLAK